MILLEFIFQSLPHFVGCLILLLITYRCIETVAGYIARIFSGPRS